MVKFWKNDESFKEINVFQKDSFVKITKPTPEEISFLESLNIPIDIIHDILDIDERSRVQYEDDLVIIILRIPIVYKQQGIPYITIPLGFLITQESTILLCLEDNQIVDSLLQGLANGKIPADNPIDLISHAFLLSAVWYLKYLKQINFETGIIERDLEKSVRNEELHKLLRMEKSLVYFVTSLKANDILINKLKNSRLYNNSDYDEDLFEDASIEIKQAIDTANIHSDILSGMMDAFASVISNNLNVIMKRLTSISIILMIPTLIASFYGMNVPNFFERSNFGFLGVAVLSMGISLIAAIMFRKRNWF